MVVTGKVNKHHNHYIIIISYNDAIYVGVGGLQPSVTENRWQRFGKGRIK